MTDAHEDQPVVEHPPSHGMTFRETFEEACRLFGPKSFVRCSFVATRFSNGTTEIDVHVGNPMEQDVCAHSPESAIAALRKVLREDGRGVDELLDNVDEVSDATP